MLLPPVRRAASSLAAESEPALRFELQLRRRRAHLRRMQRRRRRQQRRVAWRWRLERVRQRLHSPCCCPLLVVTHVCCSTFSSARVRSADAGCAEAERRESGVGADLALLRLRGCECAERGCGGGVVSPVSECSTRYTFDCSTTAVAIRLIAGSVSIRRSSLNGRWQGRLSGANSTASHPPARSEAHTHIDTGTTRLHVCAK